ncbi:MAG: polyribonucleotide nucleotidyltransferase [Candidatus Omnitrophica bacterium]|nr:polyribonucleotide nucleotidyltransferase [Candidatus Omnitrophota bacterium]
MNKKIEIPFGNSTLSLESNFVAKQSDGSVWARVGDTVVLATVVSSKQPREDIDFFPLICDYREYISSIGKIPGGFFKREGKPTEREILVSRLIDRSIRPLFPDGYRKEVQVIVSVFSADMENNPDVPAVVAVSSAITASKIPFFGPVCAVRIGLIDNKYVINPTNTQMKDSLINMIISGTEDSILMIEGDAKECSEEQFLEAVNVGHQEIKKVIEKQKEFIGEKEIWEEEKYDEEIKGKAYNFISERLEKAYEFPEKKARTEFYETIKQEFILPFTDEKKEEAEKVFEKTLETNIRRLIVGTGRRLDGRSPSEIRPLECIVGLLPRTHGSALFTRGQTQCLASVTLGTSRDEQIVEGLHEEMTRRFMVHYNFPPFSVGEVAPLRGASRREIGHGALAARALEVLIPSEEEFSYTIRIVAEILESNGSSSMATVCAGSLALMDAGVPVRKHVAGISIGMIKEGDKYILLTDIAGEEDHYGNLDFKIAGTEDGITGFQMDVKETGLTLEIMEKALYQSKEARKEILKKMYATISSPRETLSRYAPRIISLKIKTDKIGLVIGPGGKTIKKIIEDTGTEIDISDDGTVRIYSPDSQACEEAADVIRALTEEPEPGKIYEGKVVKIMSFGAFVQFLPGKEGLVHISELAPYRVNKVEDVIKEGDTIPVKFLGFDEQGRAKLSRKQAIGKPKKS